MSEQTLGPPDHQLNVCIPDETGRCLTCADEALPVRVVAVDQHSGLAQVVLDGAASEVDVTLIDDVCRGQILLVHAGVALARLEESDGQPGGL